VRPLCVVQEKKGLQKAQKRGKKKPKVQHHLRTRNADCTICGGVCASSSKDAKTRCFGRSDHPEPRGIHVGGCTRARFDRGFEETAVATRAFCPVLFFVRRDDASIVKLLLLSFENNFGCFFFVGQLLFIIGEFSRPRTTKREERKRRETHSAGSLHGLGHDFSEFFVAWGV